MIQFLELIIKKVSDVRGFGQETIVERPWPKVFMEKKVCLRIFFQPNPKA
jgi:hypothetical protein